MAEVVTILKLRPVGRPPTGAGSQMVAIFDFQARGLILRGCSLVRLPPGEFIMYLPRLGTNAAEAAGTRAGGGVGFADHGLRRAVVAAAVAEFVQD